MRRFFSFWWMCAKKAFWGNTAFANDWQWVFGVPVITGLLGFLAANKGVSEITTGYPILDGFLTAFGAFVGIWSVACLVRLFDAPVQLYREARSAITLAASGPIVRDVSLYDAICRMFLGRWEKIPIVDGHLDLTASGFQSIHDLIDQATTECGWWCAQSYANRSRLVLPAIPRLLENPRNA